MDRVLLSRLFIISEEIKKFTDCAVTQSTNYNHDDMTNSRVVVAKLKGMLGKFGHELHTYFNTSQEPDVDDVSTLTTIQLQGEEALAELEVKIEIGVNLEKGTTSSTTTAVVSSKLPKLSLPIFEGDIVEWHQFWDQFSSNIDKRNLPDVDKLQYLKISLKGEAQKTIDGLDVTNKNYQIAVTLLKQRYGKESQVIDAHYTALYKIEAAKTSADCRKTLNDIERHLRVLSSMGEDVNNNHLRFLIMEKFPEDILYDLKMKISNESVEEIRNKLEVIISAKEDVSRPINDTLSKDSIPYTTEALYVKDHVRYRNNQRIERGSQFGPHNTFAIKRNKPFKGQRDIGERRSNFYSERGRLRCLFCRGAHFNDQCQKVKTVEERKALIENLCHICLKGTHRDQDCTSKLKCPYCEEMGVHNRALCPKKFQVSTDTLHAG